MEGVTDPRWAAAAQWVFIYIKHQYRNGYSLNEIEKRLNSAIAQGQLNTFINTFDLVRGEFKQKFGGKSGRQIQGKGV